ncbi:MAG: hypothetical protein ABSF83_09010 [Nitrososphaerales archaeon]|jgi:hypothetical protein
MSVITTTDESGNERMSVPESKRGVLVVEGTVERLTGGGKFVVSPVREYADVDVGNRVMIIVLDKLQPEVFLETFKERVTLPFPSNWAIIVKGNRYVERCRLSYNGTQLSALDPAGVARYELPLPRDGVLNFRIPETVNLDNESTVEVKDGERSIDVEKFGSIALMPTKEAYPTVTVSGRLLPVNRLDSYPASVEFTNTATGQRYWAVTTNSEYSVQLPNRESYRATVSWTMIPGNMTGTAEAGTLTLRADDTSSTFDLNW